MDFPTSLLVTGTDTGVGKTVVSAALIRSLARLGMRVGAYKPVCSGVECGADGGRSWADLDRLKEALAEPTPLDRICPQRFEAPLAPPLAARAEGKTIDEALLTSGLQAWGGFADLVVVEGVGGILCPITDDETVADLAVKWRIPTVVVCANRLGTINHSLLTIEAIQRRGIPLIGFVMNDALPDASADAHETHIHEIERRSGAPCVGRLRWGEAELDPSAILIRLRELTAAAP
jgi:dethiobiotin synthetase